MRRYLVHILVIGLAVSLMTVGCAPAPPAAAPKAAPAAELKPMTLRAGTYNAPQTSYAVAFKWWIDEVEKRSGGKIKIEYYPAQTLFTLPNSLEAIQGRIGDIGQWFPPYFTSKLPLTSIYDPVIFRPGDQKVAWEIWTELYASVPEMQAELERFNQKLLFLIPLESYQIISSKPVKTLDDLKGLKIAAQGNWYPKWLAAVGAVPVSVPAPEMYNMMSARNIDGAVLTLPGADAFKLYEVAKYQVMTSLGAAAPQTQVINLEVWNGLPPDTQKMMLETGREAVLKFLEENKVYLERLPKEYEQKGMTLVSLSEEDKARWARAVLPSVPKDWVSEIEKMGLPGRKTMDTFVSLTKKYGHKFPVDWSLD